MRRTDDRMPLSDLLARRSRILRLEAGETEE